MENNVIVLKAIEMLQETMDKIEEAAEENKRKNEQDLKRLNEIKEELRTLGIELEVK